VSADGKHADALVRIVDDDRDFLDGISFMLEAKGWKTAGYLNPRDFLRQDAPSVPGCLILDIRMPQMSGIELQAEMRRRGIALPIIILTGHADVESAVRTLKMGASDFLQKPVDPKTLFEAVESAVRLSRITRQGGLSPSELAAVLAAFSQREKQITALLMQGLTNSAISERLGVTTKTVQNYRNTVYGKLRVHSTAGLLEALALIDKDELAALLGSNR
jgi:FixJ family two-component response regulator